MSKRRGAYTVEFAFLMVIVLGTFLLFSSVQSIIEKNGLLYSAVDQSIYQLSDDIYLYKKLKAKLIDPAVYKDIEQMSQLKTVLGLQLLQSLDEKIEVVIKNAITAGIEERFKNPRSGSLNQYLGLCNDITYNIQWGNQVLLVETTTKYKVLDLFGILPTLTLQDKHIIPLKNVPEGEFLEVDKSELVTVYLTTYGKTTSKKYHNQMCWTLKRSKTMEPFEVEAILVKDGQKLTINNVDYTLCLVCKKENQK
jgi:hypothetical protein